MMPISAWQAKKKTLLGNPRRKIGEAMQFFEIISLESQQKCWHQHFSEKRRKGYFFTDFLRIRLYRQKSKRL